MRGMLKLVGCAGTVTTTAVATRTQKGAREISPSSRSSVTEMPVRSAFANEFEAITNCRDEHSLDDLHWHWTQHTNGDTPFTEQAASPPCESTAHQPV